MVLHADFMTSRIDQVFNHTLTKRRTVSWVFDKSGIDGRVAMFQVGNAVPISWTTRTWNCVDRSADCEKNRVKIKKFPFTWCPNRFQLKQNLKFAIDSNKEFSQKNRQIEGRSVRLAKLYIKFREFFLNFDFLLHLYPELVGKPSRFFIYQKWWK